MVLLLRDGGTFREGGTKMGKVRETFTNIEFHGLLYNKGYLV